MDSRYFYQNLPVISSFKDVLDFSRYHRFPEDWHIVVADIRNSTKYTREGRYKEVNMAGAMIVAAVCNICKKQFDIPFQFTGDGAIVAVPDALSNEIDSLISFCKNSVKDAFGLDLVIGVKRISEVYKQGYGISVARFALSKHVTQSMFLGDGLEWVEKTAKEVPERLDLNQTKSFDLSGLECRWQNIPAGKDEVTAYLVQAVGADLEKTYQRCAEKFTSIYGEDDRGGHPLSLSGIQLTMNPFKLSVEWRIRTRSFTFLRKLYYTMSMLLQFFTAKVFMGFGISTSETNWSDYRPDLIRNSDYRKFGSGIRCILSSTKDQRKELEKFLEREYQEKRLVYGIHSSKAAIITCYVKAYQSDHVHFVDGSDGGYTLASVRMKERLKQI